MADDLIHKQEFAVRGLSTRNITFYPTKAQVVRDLNDISLKPGANEITIHGVTPTADDTSIKVDGKGSATITDMTVDLEPNREVYEDIYPSDSEDEESDEEEDTDSNIEDQLEATFGSEFTKINEAIQRNEAERSTAQGQLGMLEQYAKSLERERPADVKPCLEAYRREAQEAKSIIITTYLRSEELNKELAKAKKKLSKTEDNLLKEQKKRDKEKDKIAEKKERVRAEKQEAKRRLKEERAGFWPRKTFRVVVSIDAAYDTPASSRRGSIESLPTMKQPSTASDPYQISLSLSYITHSAYWMPRYDLSLNTPNASGSVIYRSEYCNSTSETWKDAKISLSTSEAAFSGVGETIPTLWPWNIQLAKKSGFNGGGGGDSNAFRSAQEKSGKREHVPTYANANEPRNSLFGLDNVGHQAPFNALKPQPHHIAAGERGGLFGGFGSNVNNNTYNSNTTGLFGAPAPGSQNAFGEGIAARTQNVQSRSLFGAGRIAQRRSVSADRGRKNAFQDVEAEVDAEEASNAEELAYMDEDDGATMVPQPPSLTTEEATWAEDGLTFSYEIPGLRTIAPSFTKRRFRIASIPFKSVELSHMLVPKLRAAAFLKARLHNSSTVTLLRGLAGITLDGTFLGNTHIPRCSAGERFNLSLGVDPSVQVTYAKPVVKRSSTGLFQKDENATYTRSCTIMNTKPGRAIEGTLLDQVPVSQDERLKSVIVRPVGLSEVGARPRPDGKGVTRDGKEETTTTTSGVAEKKWGKAVATLKEAGKVQWEFKIEAGKGAKFVLEYETKCPSGESIVAA